MGVDLVFLDGGIPDPCRKSDHPACLIFGMYREFLGIDQVNSGFFEE